jgi:hypothetical protein
VLRQWLFKFWAAETTPTVSTGQLPPPAPPRTPSPIAQVDNDASSSRRSPSPLRKASVGSGGVEENGLSKGRVPVSDSAAQMPKDKKTDGEELCVTDMKLVDHVALCSDLIRLQDTFTGEFMQVVHSQLDCHHSRNSSPLLEASTSLCYKCSEEVSQCIPLVVNQIVRIVSKECIDTLIPPLRSITSLYRMTKKPTPTRYSFFVPTLLGALQTFHAMCHLQQQQQQSTSFRFNSSSQHTDEKHYYCPLPAHILMECVEAILTAVTNAYYTEAKALLIGAKKAEKAISAMRKQKQKEIKSSNADGKEDMGDTDKIYVQIYLDIMEYGNQFQTNFGITKQQIIPFQRLLKLVKRAQWLLGELDCEPPPDGDELEENTNLVSSSIDMTTSTTTTATATT